jgi:two-component system, chemotaxis family, response regulator WspF
MRSSPRLLPAPYFLVTLGASAGGPQAIATFLSALPPDFPAALVIVQHGSADFSRRLVPWFQAYSALRVRFSEAGMRPMPGEVLVVATDHHVVLRANQTLVYLGRSPGLHYSPSIDLWFDSLAQYWHAPGIAILLTGMGQDGALGLKKLRDRHWYTFAQDESSSSIHSMPKAAIELGAAYQVLSPEKIAAMCVCLCVQGVG